MFQLLAAFKAALALDSRDRIRKRTEMESSRTLRVSHRNVLSQVVCRRRVVCLGPKKVRNWTEHIYWPVLWLCCIYTMPCSQKTPALVMTFIGSSHRCSSLNRTRSESKCTHGMKMAGLSHNPRHLVTCADGQIS